MSNYHGIKSEIDDFLERSGKSAYWLSVQSGVNINVIQRVRRGLRKDMKSMTADKIRSIIMSTPTTNPTSTPCPLEAQPSGHGQ